MKALNIIGAGRVGSTLAALWNRHGVFAIGQVLNRSRGSAEKAIQLIGDGTAADTWQALRSADVWLLATPDSEIARAGTELAASGRLRAQDVVFHCSGALGSNLLRPVLTAGVHVASVHPLKSFADPRAAVRGFAGTYCAAEGDSPALALLVPAFEAIGARVTTIDAQAKTLYHAASVMVCNYLTALMESGLQCYEKAGLPRATASAMMEPLVRETVDNVFNLGTVNALTGPIARGDHEVVARQLGALRALDSRLGDIYRSLGVIAVELAGARGKTNDSALARLRQLLKDPDGASRDDT